MNLSYDTYLNRSITGAIKKSQNLRFMILLNKIKEAETKLASDK